MVGPMAVGQGREPWSQVILRRAVPVLVVVGPAGLLPWVCVEWPSQCAGPVLGAGPDSMSSWNKAALSLRMEEPRGPQKRQRS